MSGMDRNTGRTLDGWPHVEQSIGVLLTTSEKARVMRRAFGAGLPRRVDSPISPMTLIDFYADIAKSISDYEPRFKVTRTRLDTTPDKGSIAFVVEGIYYPRGAVGDFSVSIPQSTTVSL